MGMKPTSRRAALFIAVDVVTGAGMFAAAFTWLAALGICCCASKGSSYTLAPDSFAPLLAALAALLWTLTALGMLLYERKLSPIDRPARHIRPNALTFTLCMASLFLVALLIWVGLPAFVDPRVVRAGSDNAFFLVATLATFSMCVALTSLVLYHFQRRLVFLCVATLVPLYGMLRITFSPEAVYYNEALPHWTPIGYPSVRWVIPATAALFLAIVLACAAERSSPKRRDAGHLLGLTATVWAWALFGFVAFRFLDMRRCMCHIEPPPYTEELSIAGIVAVFFTMWGTINVVQKRRLRRYRERASRPFHHR
jgi:hypothetical protein